MSELKPCPFCGGAADYAETTDTVDGQEFRIYLAGCPNHCAQIWQGDPDSAAAAWNTRTPALSAVREKLEEAKQQAEIMYGTLYGGYAIDIVDDITAALKLLEGDPDAQS